MLTGPDALGAFIETAIERFDHFSFVILNTVVDVDADTARGRIFMCEIRHDTASDEWTIAHGLYRTVSWQALLIPHGSSESLRPTVQPSEAVVNPIKG